MARVPNMRETDYLGSRDIGQVRPPWQSTALQGELDVSRRLSREAAAVGKPEVLVSRLMRMLALTKFASVNDICVECWRYLQLYVGS